jgi:hypothetical protein
MSGEIITPGAADQGDAFAIFATASPTLDTVRRLGRLFEWCEQQRGLRTKLDSKDPKHHKIAKARFTGIPDDAAELESAPEWWLHAAIGLTFDSLSNGKKVSPNVRAGIVDSMLFDQAVHAGYDPGFSAPVIVEMAREVRRTTKEYLPMPAKILELCAESRARFARRRVITSLLMGIRQTAEDLLIETGEVKVGDDDEYEFKPDEALQQWLSGQRPVPLLSSSTG